MCPEALSVSCPICGKFLDDFNNRNLNDHIDRCLGVDLEAFSVPMPASVQIKKKKFKRPVKQSQQPQQSRSDIRLLLSLPKIGTQPDAVSVDAERQSVSDEEPQTASKEERQSVASFFGVELQ